MTLKFSFFFVVGERPYHCKHCDKSFATTISLKTHTYIHTGEKPHKCPHCPKTFATSSKLGRHIVTHSEQRPFACDHCPKSFNRSGENCTSAAAEPNGTTHSSMLTNNLNNNSNEHISICNLRHSSLLYALEVRFSKS